MANPRIHVICGMCGSREEMSYEVVSDAEGTYVHLSCANCASLTNLDEVLPTREQYRINQGRADHGVIS